MNKYFKLAGILLLLNFIIAYLGIEVAPLGGWKMLAGIYWFGTACGFLGSLFEGITEYKYRG